MKREYAEAYVKWADSDGFNLDFTSGDGVICGGFTAIFLIAAVSAQRFVFASILFVLLFGYCVLIAILKQKLQILTYFQKFLNIGASGLFTRVMFLLMSLTILEVTGMYGIWYYLLLIGAWLLINLSDFGFTWWRIRIGKFYALQEQVKERKKQKGKQGQKRRGGALALACVVGGLGGGWAGGLPKYSLLESVRRLQSILQFGFSWFSVCFWGWEAANYGRRTM